MTRYTTIAILHNTVDGPEVVVSVSDHDSIKAAATKLHEDMTYRQASLGAYDCHEDCDTDDPAQEDDHTEACHELQDAAPWPQVWFVVDEAGDIHDVREK